MSWIGFKRNEKEPTTQSAYMHQAAIAWCFIPELLVRGLFPTGLTGYFASKYIKRGLDVKQLYNCIEQTKFNASCTGELEGTTDWPIDKKLNYLKQRADYYFARSQDDAKPMLEKILEILATLLGAVLGLISLQNVNSSADIVETIQLILERLLSSNFLLQMFVVVLVALFLLRIIEGFNKKYLDLYCEALDVLIGSFQSKDEQGEMVKRENERKDKDQPQITWQII